MKKLILLVSTLALASASYACGGGSCGGEKKTDGSAPTEQAPQTPKS